MGVSIRKESSRRRLTAPQIALQCAHSGYGQLIKASDIEGPSPAAVSKALARLAKQGILQRVSKGLYFAPRNTPLGPSHPSAAAIAAKVLEGKSRPTGTTAANLLGLSTQVPACPEYVVFSWHHKGQFRGMNLHFRRACRPHSLDAWQGALLEVLRDRGRYIDTEPNDAIARLTSLLAQADTPTVLRHLGTVALDEPPRVRAMLGALLECSGCPEDIWIPLKGSLNPLTRFEFGFFESLPNGKEWQAK